MKRFAPLRALARLLTHTPAHAFNWSLGANLGLTILSPSEDGQESITVFGWPSPGFLNIITTPGLRVGFAGENPQHQFYLDTGMTYFSTDGASFRSTQLTGNYQYNFASGGSTAPYLTGGLGFNNLSSDDFFGEFGATSIVFGAGVGLQHRIGNGNGTLRAELRVDRAGEGEDNNAPIIPESTNIGLKMGFDLWMK
jgi:hypothetical protein